MMSQIEENVRTIFVQASTDGKGFPLVKFSNHCSKLHQHKQDYLWHHKDLACRDSGIGTSRKLDHCLLK